MSASQIQYKVHPNSGGGGIETQIVGPGIIGHTLIGLQSATQYQLRIRHDCDQEISPFKYRGFITGGLRGAGEIGQTSIYPNPATDALNVAISDFTEMASADVEIEMIDILGRQIYKWEGSGKGTLNHTIDIAEQPGGQYIVRITMADRVVSKTVIVSK